MAPGDTRRPGSPFGLLLPQHRCRGKPGWEFSFVHGFRTGAQTDLPARRDFAFAGQAGHGLFRLAAACGPLAPFRCDYLTPWKSTAAPNGRPSSVRSPPTFTSFSANPIIFLFSPSISRRSAPAADPRWCSAASHRRGTPFDRHHRARSLWAASHVSIGLDPIPTCWPRRKGRLSHRPGGKDGPGASAPLLPQELAPRRVCVSVRPELRRMIQFQRINLLEPNWRCEGAARRHLLPQRDDLFRQADPVQDSFRASTPDGT